MSALLDRILNRRQAATVPSMDGVLRPNEELDRARTIASAPAPDNLVQLGPALLFSSGPDIFSLPGKAAKAKPKLLHHFDAAVTAIAASPTGALAVGLDGAGVRIVGGAHNGLALASLGGRPANCPTALCFPDENTLFICIGSTQNGPLEWQRDLMEMRATGSLWRVDLRSKSETCVAEGLAFPNGIIVRGSFAAVSESWSHRLLRFDANGKLGRPEVLLEDLPGYPGRLAPAANGGAWLAIFAPRSQLIEFVLRERAYCERMMREIPKPLWIAPTLRSGASFSEPMQGGAVRVHGIFKPWAPTRSYGLAVLLNAELAPVRSFHSRADGNCHGIVSVCEWNGAAVFASKGNDLLCTLPLSQSGKTEPTS